MSAKRRIKSYYELLEIEPSASEEEVRRAHRRLKEIYALDSPAVHGAYTTADLEALLQQFDDAYAVLMDEEKRRIYDVELKGESSAAEAAAKVGALREAEETESPEEVEGSLEELCGPDSDFSGDVLQRIRKLRGLSLNELATRTKVKSSYLRALEAEEWDQLPASVYVRGFLQNYARELRIDAGKVLSAYFPRLKRYYEEQKRD